MLFKPSLLALCAAPMLASALILHAPSEPTSQGEVTITWDQQAGDPEAFTLELNHPDFNDALAIANNIDPARGSITLTLPVVPAKGGYTIEAVNIGNINDVYSTTPEFAVGEVTGSVSAPTASATGTQSQSASTGVPSASSVSRASTASSASSTRSASTSASSGPPVVTNLAGSNGASTMLASKFGLLGAALVAFAL